MKTKKAISLIISFIILLGIFPVSAQNGDEAAAEAVRALSRGITLTGDYDKYISSDGTEVSVKWNNVRDNTISDEKGSYQNDTYLRSDGRVTRPKWYEGTKKLIADAELSCGGASASAKNVNITLPPEGAPSFNENTLSNYINIGDSDSEKYGFECVRDNGVQQRDVDGVKQTYRTLNKNGAMAVTLKCDPEKQNYFTVKFWGGDTGDGILWVCDPTTGYMNIDNSKQPTRNGIVDRKDWVELITTDSEPQYSGGFIYSTYLIPMIYTKGKNYVSLRIYSTGGPANYANVTIKEQTEPSRGIYAAYMTQEADFDPAAFEEIVGEAADTAEAPPVDYAAAETKALNAAKKAVGTFKSWQIYGANNYPSYMEGMVTRGTSWKNKKINDSDWKNAYYRSSGGMLQQNLTPLNMFELFAEAYSNSEKLGYTQEEKTELLDRIVKGADFLTRAQGSSGGFYGSNGWIGGPERKPASGNNLTGFGLRSVARALNSVYGDIDESGYLSKYIDSDGDGELDTVRRAAWRKMAEASRDFLTSLDGCGHAPNQDMADTIAALYFDKLAVRAGGSGLSDNEITELLDRALGFSPSLACSSYWVSPKGLILENFGSIQGGYSGDYGIMALGEMSQLAEFAEKYLPSETAAKYSELVDKAYEMSDNFMFVYGKDRPTLYAEGITSSRNSYYPGTERYILDPYAALERGSKTALKTYENFMAHDILSREAEAYTPSNAHFEDNALTAMELYLDFDEIKSAVESGGISEYNYIMEDPSVDEYAAADEMGRNVVIKNGDDKIYLALNWRNPIHSVTYYNTSAQKDMQSGVMNNMARVHHITGRYDKIGYAAVSTEGWSVRTADSEQYKRFDNHYAEAFMYMSYGDYKIIMNSNNLMGAEKAVSYNVPVSELGLSGLYKDLISGKVYYFGDEYKTDGAENGAEAQVPPASTMVLYKTANFGEFEIYLDGTEYADGNVRVKLSTDRPDADGRAVTVYAAEYNTDGALADVKYVTETVRSDTEITFPYSKKADENTVKIFVWDETQRPINVAISD